MQILALGAVGLVAAAAACSQQAKPKSSASASPTVNSAATLAAWRACGSDVVPPSSVLATPKLPFQVDVSKTNGAVSQTEADKGTVAFLREQNIEDWAITTNRDGLLKGGCLGSNAAYDNLFAGEVSTIQRAKAAGGHVQYDPLATAAAIAIAPAPAQAQTYVANLSGQSPQYAVVGTLQGPINAYIVDSAGHKQLIGHTAAGVVFRRANFGQYEESQIGAIWFQLASDDCASAWMAGTCAS
jgi:hypothetical protein